MRVGPTVAVGCLIAFAGLSTAACGGDGGSEDGGEGQRATDVQTLTVYSSLPLQGDSRPQSEDIVRGERLALEETGGRVGRFRIEYRSLDDAVAATGKWDPGRVSENARAALADDSAIAYLGEFNSGASAISIPLLNEAGILQVSPANTYVGLTRAEGADEGEPTKYYPSGKRTFGRVVPADHIQAAAQVSYMQAEGVKRLFILNDREVYGKGLADQVAQIAEARGIRVVGNEGIDTKAANFRSAAAKVRARRADAFFFGGITQNKAVQVFKDVGSAAPKVKLFGPDGVAESAFSTKLGSVLERRVHITNPTLDPSDYPPSAQGFFSTFESRYGKTPEPYAIYGYEAMKVVLDAIKGAGTKGDDRGSVVRAFFEIKDRESVLGTYSIDENGDTTLSDYGGYTIVGGELRFQKVIKAATGQ